MSIQKYIYIVIDLETTGLDIKSNRICSIGASLLYNDEENFEQIYIDNTTNYINNDYEFYSYINPLQPNYAYHINGISDETLREANRFSYVMSAFWQWVIKLSNKYQKNDIVFIGHNLDNFDEPMLISEIRRNKTLIPNLNIYKIDTMKIFKYLYPITFKTIPYSLPCIVHCPESYKQSDIYKFLFHNEPEYQHNAIGDVRALHKILQNYSIRNIFQMCEPENSKLF